MVERAEAGSQAHDGGLLNFAAVFSPVLPGLCLTAPPTFAGSLWLQALRAAVEGTLLLPADPRALIGVDLGEGCARIPPQVPPMGPHGTPVYGPAQPSSAPAPAQLWNGSWGTTSRDEPGSLCLGAGSRGGCCRPPHSTLPGHNPGVSAGSDTAGSCSFLGVRPCCSSKTGIVLLGRVQTCLAPRAAEDPVQFTFSKGQILPLLRTANLSDLL